MCATCLGSERGVQRLWGWWYVGHSHHASLAPLVRVDSNGGVGGGDAAGESSKVSRVPSGKRKWRNEKSDENEMWLAFWWRQLWGCCWRGGDLLLKWGFIMLPDVGLIPSNSHVLILSKLILMLNFDFIIITLFSVTSPVACKKIEVIKTKANAGPLHAAQKLNNLCCWILKRTSWIMTRKRIRPRRRGYSPTEDGLSWSNRQVMV